MHNALILNDHTIIELHWSETPNIRIIKKIVSSIAICVTDDQILKERYDGLLFLAASDFLNKIFKKAKFNSRCKILARYNIQ